MSNILFRLAEQLLTVSRLHSPLVSLRLFSSVFWHFLNVLNDPSYFSIERTNMNNNDDTYDFLFFLVISYCGQHRVESRIDFGRSVASRTDSGCSIEPGPIYLPDRTLYLYTDDRNLVSEEQSVPVVSMFFFFQSVNDSSTRNLCTTVDAKVGFR